MQDDQGREECGACGKPLRNKNAVAVDGLQLCKRCANFGKRLVDRAAAMIESDFPEIAKEMRKESQSFS